VPSAREAGLPDVQVISFNGVLAPAGTPAPIIKRLHDDIVKIMNTPEMKERMASQVGVASTSTPEEFAKILSVDFEKWLAVIKRNGIHAD
jgi:tripartite-type tricarboxylate transporter receptor subunit TctC